jgi:hypothetical protein
MKRNYTLILTLFTCLNFFLPAIAKSQCSFTATASATESRCAATGVITVTTTGGSGSFNYKLTGPIPETVTSSNVISGLPAGTYTVEVTDIVQNCVRTISNVVVAGNYQDPRFQINATDVTCINGTNGTLTAVDVQFGRPAFLYTIVAPSASGIGTSNTTGVFNNLPAGSYSVRLTDSCGGIQTRLAVIANYDWWISQSSVTKVGCDNADAVITVTDSKGNTNIANPSVFAGFTYGVSRTPGDTLWFTTRSFSFPLLHKRSVKLVVKDACGNIKYVTWSDTAIPAIGASVSISNKGCSDFSATVTGQVNLTSPVFSLLNSSNVVIATNGAGIFNNVPYGSYCIRMFDACYDTTITRCFTVNRLVPSVAATLTTSNITCSSFTATVTGQTNLFNPEYCIYDNANVQIACNFTGVFNLLPIGTYCIKITNNSACYDTVINRCVTVTRPKPNVAAAATITNMACSTFTATLGGGVNLNNPWYCIFTPAGDTIACNGTGIFNGLPYGSYCINVKNDPVCYDTTIVRCFTVNRPVPAVASAVSLTRACSTFTATITGQTNLNSPNYCIYDNNNVEIACNTTGIFPNLPYGNYCISIKNSAACYDTTIVRCFTASRLKPSVSNTVKINNKTCTDFRAEIEEQTNLTSPTYCLFNSADVPMGCNTNGRFNNLPYGSYCIKITTPCYDTTITRCFTVAQPILDLDIDSHPECDHGFAHVEMNFKNGIAPYEIKVYNPGGVLIRTINSTTTFNEIYDLPVLPGGLQYKFVGSDACGRKDSMYHALKGLVISKAVIANSKCPGGSYPNGYGDMVVTSTNNAGQIVPKIIKKDGVAFVMNATTAAAPVYTFSNLGPATYVIEYTIQSSCSNKYYDTFQLKPYTYPSLGQSAVYQCSNNSFSVSAAVTGGIGPFTYEILGSIPSAPSIVSAPQASPLFNITNGVDYSLVNLRAIDACGNGTVNDVSVLPLANTTINASSNCYYNNIILTVPSIANVTYSWYRKTSPTDSVLVGASNTYQIPYLLPTDTGIYVCKTVLNNGCLTRFSQFAINGACGGVPLSTSGIEFNGALQGEDVKLHWKTQPNFEAESFVVERSSGGNGFISIGTVISSSNNSSGNQYYFNDTNVPEGPVQYRVRVIKRTDSPYFTQIVRFNKTGSTIISVMPNPVKEVFDIQFGKITPGNYSIRLVNATGMAIMTQYLNVREGDIKRMSRPVGSTTGIYFLVIQNQANNEQKTLKLIFQ